MKNQIGEESYPRTYSCQGQPVTEFQSCIGFVLTNDYFRKAGKFCWPDKIRELGKPGISLNRTIFSRICKHFYSDQEKPLIVYNAPRDQYYRLERYETVFDNVEFWDQYGKDLVVTPLSAYDEIGVDEVPSKVADLAAKKC